MPDDGVRLSAALETVDLDGSPSVVEEDFALHVAVENGVFTFDMVSIITALIKHFIRAASTLQDIVSRTSRKIVVMFSTNQRIISISTKDIISIIKNLMGINNIVLSRT